MIALHVAVAFVAGVLAGIGIILALAAVAGVVFEFFLDGRW